MGGQHHSGERNHSAEGERASRFTDGEEARMLPIGETVRMLRPIRFHLISCAVLTAISAAAGFAPYLAIVEIARHIFSASSFQEVAFTVWTWVGIGAAGAALR